MANQPNQIVWSWITWHIRPMSCPKYVFPTMIYLLEVVPPLGPVAPQQTFPYQSRMTPATGGDLLDANVYNPSDLWRAQLSPFEILARTPYLNKEKHVK